MRARQVRESLRPKTADDGRGFAPLALVAVLALAAAYLLVSPIGEYAIDDEWTYMVSLRHLQNEGRIVILDWNPMSLVGHLVWGLLFTLPLGFSFTVARLAVVTLFAVECLTMVAALRHFRVSIAVACVAVATMALNPLHFFHGFLFETDVPALAWTLLAFLLYAKALDGVGQRGGTVETTLFALGSLCAGWSFLVRQSGVLVVGALVLYVLAWDRRRVRSPRFLLAALAPAAAMIGGFSWWYDHVRGPTAMFTWYQRQIAEAVLHPDAAASARGAFSLGIYLGFFLAPLSLVLRPSPLRAGATAARVTGAAVALAGLAALVYLGVAEDTVFPYLRNKITPFGYLRPNELILGNREVLWTRPVAWVASVVFLASFVVFAGALTRALAGASRGRAGRVAVPSAASPDPPGESLPSGARLLLILFGLQALYLLVMARLSFDRHLLLIAPTAVLLLCVLVRDAARVHVPAFVALMLPFALYAVAGSHDLHAMSRTAFHAGEDLLREGVDVHAIDAGYAFDGWQVFEAQQPGQPFRARPTDGWWVQHLFASIRTDFVVALSPTLDYAAMAPAITGDDRELFLVPRLDGYRVYRTYRYRTFWPWGERTMYVLVDREVGGSWGRITGPR